MYFYSPIATSRQAVPGHKHPFSRLFAIIFYECPVTIHPLYKDELDHFKFHVKDDFLNVILGSSGERFACSLVPVAKKHTMQ